MSLRGIPEGMQIQKDPLIPDMAALGPWKYVIMAVLLLVGAVTRKMLAAYTDIPVTPLMLIALIGIVAYQMHSRRKANAATNTIVDLQAKQAALLREGESALRHATAGGDGSVPAFRQQGRETLSDAQRKADRLRQRNAGTAARRSGLDSMWRNGDSLQGEMPPTNKRDRFKGDAKWYREGAPEVSRADRSYNAAVRDAISEPGAAVKGPVHKAVVPDNVKVTDSGRRLYMGRSKERLAKIRRRNRARQTDERSRGVAAEAKDSDTGDGRGVAAALERVDVAPTEPTQPTRAVVADLDHRSVAENESVQDLLRGLGLAEYYPAFEAEAMTDLALLADMAGDPRGLRDSLKEIGVLKMGHRERIALEVQKRAAVSASMGTASEHTKGD